jgi:ABC-type multidrug transport system fused ATPase/permease subunit
MIPFALWFVAYAAACFYFVPRLGQIGKEQADARSMMTGRVTDAYTNIATVKLFAHTRREADMRAMPWRPSRPRAMRRCVWSACSRSPTT